MLFRSSLKSSHFVAPLFEYRQNSSGETTKEVLDELETDSDLNPMRATQDVDDRAFDEHSLKVRKI